MRIVEPTRYNFQSPVQKSTKKRKYVIGFSLALFALLVIGGGYVALHTFSSEPTESASAESLKQTNVSLPQVSGDEDESTDVPVPVPMTPPTPPVKSLRTFSGNEFKLFYDQLQQPNLTPVENPPVISGNTIADQRIRKIAEDRGYRLRSSPAGELSSVEGQPVQSSVVQPWLNLKKAASAQGLTLSIVSAYRSVDNQRSLYLSRLAATGATIDQVAAGTADDKVDYVLVTSSIPGYSKHHTGYTLDILCSGWAFENFKNSPCYTWISADNYKVAKENGFIPSYPVGADKQGPDPEAWEFVWVGTDLLYTVL